MRYCPNASFLSNDAFTLTRHRFTFNADGTQGANTTTTGTNTAYGIYNYGYTATDSGTSAGYSMFVPALGNLTSCTIEAKGTNLTAEILTGTSYTVTNTVNNGNCTALMNYGTVGNITDCNISGNRGISNYNLVLTPTVYDNGSSSTYLKSTVTRSVVNVGTISEIRDSSVTANYQYALLNCGHVGSLCGSSTFTVYSKITQGYAVMNSGGWYNGTVEQKTVTQRETYTKSDDTTGYRNTKITYYYDGSGTTTGLSDAADMWQSIPLPTINSITDSVTIAAVNNGTSTDWGYALNNAGRINSIGGGMGTVTIQTYTGDSATVATSNYALNNSGYIVSIGDNVTCSAAGHRAISNSGSRYADRVISYTYAREATVKTTDTVNNYRVPAYIGSIGSATLSAGSNYGIINYGWIGSLTGTTISAGTSSGIVNQADSNSSWSHTLSYAAAYIPEGYDNANPAYVEESIRFGARIGAITNASITAASSYAISNSGEIGNITGGSLKVTATGNADGYVLYNSDSYQQEFHLTRYNLGQIDTINPDRYITLEEREYPSYVEGGPHIGGISGVTFENGRRRSVYNAGTIDAIQNCDIPAYSNAIENTAGYYQARTSFRYLWDTVILRTYNAYINETNLSHTKIPAAIKSITGSTISTTTGGYGISNAGTINLIEDSSITTKTEMALYNAGTFIQKYELNLPDTTTTPAYRDYVTVKPDETGYTFSAKNKEETNGWGQIVKLGAGNTFSSTKNTVYNSGEIVEIDGGGTTEITATSETALYNYRGVQSVKVVVDGAEDTTKRVYRLASIGTVKNIKLTGTTYAIQNGDGNATYTNLIIAELGEGVEATSTGSYAVYNRTNASIGTVAEDGTKTGGITGGIYTASASGKYAVYNENTSAPIYISGGDFKGGTNNDTSKGRDYAIYQPDVTTRQTYPDNMSLTVSGKTRSVTFADGTTGSGYYYIGLINPSAETVTGETGSKEGVHVEYATLADAIKAYEKLLADGETNTYITLVNDTKEIGDINLSRDLYLNLNGCKVDLNGHSLNLNGYKLYGMDSRTNSYLASGETPGQIIGTITGTVPVVYNNEDIGANAKKSYVTVTTTDGNTEFHRFSITPIVCRFYYNPSDDHSHLAFKAALQGDVAVIGYNAETINDTVIGKIMDLGFTIKPEDDTAETIWYVDAATLNDPIVFEGTDEELIDGKAYKTVSFVAVDYKGTTGFDTNTPLRQRRRFEATTAMILSPVLKVHLSV